MRRGALQDVILQHLTAGEEPPRMYLRSKFRWNIGDMVEVYNASRPEELEIYLGHNQRIVNDKKRVNDTIRKLLDRDITVCGWRKGAHPPSVVCWFYSRIGWYPPNLRLLGGFVVLAAVPRSRTEIHTLVGGVQ